MMEKEKKKNNNLPEGWETEPFVDTLDDFKAERTKQIQANAYLTDGSYPIVDQGQELIAGWSNDESAVIKDGLPIIIFGDHTRIFKYIDFPFAIGADGTKLIKPQSRFDARYFYYYLLILDIQSKGYSRHYKVLKENNVNYPSLPEQKKIAGILYKIQQVIEAQDEIIKKTKELKKSTMQFLFTRGIYGEKTKQTEIGEMPEGWGKTNLGKIIILNYGKSLPQKERIDGEYPVFGSNGIVDYHRKALVKGPGIIVGRKGSCGEVHFTNEDFWPIDTTYYVTLNSKVDLKFISYLLDYLNLSEMNSHSTIPGLNREIVYRIDCNLPPLPEQKEIASILYNIDQKTELAERKKQTLNNLFQSMLNKLMTGEICVKDIKP